LASRGRSSHAVEKASIDEAFLDLSLMVNERMLAQHPYLAVVPTDAPDGLDSILPPAPPIDWSKAGEVFPVNGPDGDKQEITDEDERSEDGRSEDGQVVTPRKRRNEATWGDWALCLGAEIMAEVREEVWRRLHYTCSAVGHRS
jgi:DNA polymerase eta